VRALPQPSEPPPRHYTPVYSLTIMSVISSDSGRQASSDVVAACGKD